ncbi:hypothetical protein ACFXGA_27040 [Actinosynnema sp. NPDC059335]
MTVEQPDTIECHEAEEAFRPDDVDLATHNPNRCNLDVSVYPACAAAEHG